MRSTVQPLFRGCKGKSRTMLRRKRVCLCFLMLCLTAPGIGPDFQACGETPPSRKTQGRLLFTSQGKTAIVRADGTGLRYFDFKVPKQATWQPGPSFPDGKRIVFLSM